MQQGFLSYGLRLFEGMIKKILPLDVSVEYFSSLLVVGKAQFNVGSANPRQVSLGYIKKQLAEQGRGNKAVSSIPLWPLFQFLLPESDLALISCLDIHQG